MARTTRRLAPLRASLLALQASDLGVRAELEADGSLFQGYHPRMEAVHRANAAQLQLLISQFGWPHEAVAGADGAEAAWLVAQHAIAEPGFMRLCRELLAAEVAAGRAPQWQWAYLEDRIRVCEGRPQRFGTQFEFTPTGPVLCETEEPASLDERRQQAGLEPLARRLQSLAGSPRPSEQAYRARKAEEAAWRVRVGWVAGNGA